ncbi:MAG: hypothetical protein JJU41_09720 [Bacteroidetes bacterium]|nr:hypothetical protein [Bacteroidota bacterium]
MIVLLCEEDYMVWLNGWPNPLVVLCLSDGGSEKERTLQKSENRQTGNGAVILTRNLTERYKCVVFIAG